MQEQRDWVDEDNRGDFGGELRVFEHVRADDGAVSGSVSKVMYYNVWTGRLYECETSTKVSKPCLARIFSISRHISSFGNAACVMRNEIGRISIAMMPTSAFVLVSLFI